jgi:hypothetical protein
MSGIVMKKHRAEEFSQISPFGLLRHILVIVQKPLISGPLIILVRIFIREMNETNTKKIKAIT